MITSEGHQNIGRNRKSGETEEDSGEGKRLTETDKYRTHMQTQMCAPSLAM